MLTTKEKKDVAKILRLLILASSEKGGINTRKLIQGSFDILIQSIPHLNKHHLAGMLAWVSQEYTFLIRTPGCSIIV